MPRKPKPSFVLDLPLDTSSADVRRLEDRFLCGKRLANVMLQDGIRIVAAIRADERWAAARAMPRATEDQRIARGEAFKSVRVAHGFTSSAFDRRAIEHKNRAKFTGRIGSHETQKIAGRIFAALEQWLLGKRGKPRFKGFKRPLHSLEGKNNSGMLQWKPQAQCLQMGTGWKIPVKLPALDRDEWLWTALQAQTKYCRVIWRQHHGKRCWYVQLVQQGHAPMKASVLARLAAKDTVGGIDIGPSNLAWVTETEAGLFRFCAEVDRPHREITRLQRKIDRQRRANNPDNFLSDGRIRPGKKRWTASNRQRETESLLREMQRKEADVRRQAHGRDINLLLSKALIWRDDNVSPKALQRMYGKSIAVRAPGFFMSELQRKAERAGGARQIIDVRTLKNSQYDHATETYTKKPLSQRVHVFGDGRGRVQRDVYSAFLARNASENSYKPSELETAWTRLAPTLAISGLYVQHQTASSDTSSEALPPSGTAEGQSGSIVNPVSGCDVFDENIEQVDGKNIDRAPGASLNPRRPRRKTGKKGKPFAARRNKSKSSLLGTPRL